MFRAGEMVQQFRSLTALVEDLDLVPRTHPEWLTISCNDILCVWGGNVPKCTWGGNLHKVKNETQVNTIFLGPGPKFLETDLLTLLSIVELWKGFPRDNYHNKSLGIAT